MYNKKAKMYNKPKPIMPKTNPFAKKKQIIERTKDGLIWVPDHTDFQKKDYLEKAGTEVATYLEENYPDEQLGGLAFKKTKAGDEIVAKIGNNWVPLKQFMS